MALTIYPHCNGNTFAFMPDCIFLTGVVGYQVFTVPPEKETLYHNMLSNAEYIGVGPVSTVMSSLYRTKEAIEAAAQLYIEGHTNKDKFKIEVDRLVKEKMITEHDRNRLRIFIQTCDCVPSQIRKKLAPLGYGHLAEKIDFADKDPRLEATVDAVWEFVEPMTRIP